jgi:uncharacterized protein YjlB
MLLGRGGKDEKGGIQIPISQGDMIVLPAGTSHCSIESSKEYRYVGVYPKVPTYMENLSTGDYLAVGFCGPFD